MIEKHIVLEDIDPVVLYGAGNEGLSVFLEKKEQDSETYGAYPAAGGSGAPQPAISKSEDQSAKQSISDNTARLFKLKELLDSGAITEEEFKELIGKTPQNLSKALYTDLTGLSPTVSAELCHLASLDGDISAKDFSDSELTHLYHAFTWIMDDVRQGNFSPNIIYQKEKPVEFASIPLSMFSGGDYRSVSFPSISALLERYYAERNTVSRIHQKSTDLRKILTNSLERSYKKRDLQQKQIKDTEKREKFRIYSELLNTYGYGIQEGEKSFRCLNYYDNTEITIPLDPTLSAQENAVRYFDKYNT